MPQTPISTIQAQLDARHGASPSTGPRGVATPTLISFRARPGQGPQGALPPSAYDALIQAAAERNDLDPSLVKAVVRTESNFNPRAVSRAGAKGLMQLMDFNLPGLGVNNPFDPAQNLEGGTRMLRRLMDRYGDLPRALAAYNAGSGAVDRYNGVPPYRETQTFVARVLQAMRSYGQTVDPERPA